MKKIHINKSWFLLTVEVLIALLVLWALVVVVRHNFKDWKHFGRHKKELQIEQTQNVVTEIRKIKELTTSCYYEELVMHYSKSGTQLLTSAKDEIVVIARGKVRAGYNLADLTDQDVWVSGDTLYLNVALKAQILDVIVNPSNFEVFDETGKWSQDQVAKIKKEAAKRLRDHALRDGLLERADMVGRAKLVDICHALGYQEVMLVMKEPALIAPDGVKAR